MTTRGWDFLNEVVEEYLSSFAPELHNIASQNSISIATHKSPANIGAVEVPILKKKRIRRYISYFEDNVPYAYC